MKVIHKDRLLRLAALLRQDADNPKGVKFDLSTWGNRSALLRQLPREGIKVDCGTTACAIGLAAISGTFKDEGFSFVTDLDHTDSGVVQKVTTIYPIYGMANGFDAVQAFFGLTLSDAKFLFDNHSYPLYLQQGAMGERAVADRIDQFISDHEGRVPLQDLLIESQDLVIESTH